MTEEEWAARVDLAAAYRLIARHGWGESIYNHIALRVPAQPSAMLLKRHELTYPEVTASNLVKVPIDADLDESSGVNRVGYVLHAGLMLARPDIGASLHLHTPEIIAVSAQKSGLRMLSQYAVAFYSRIGYHDLEGAVDGFDERPRIATNLGDGVALILRHHGAVTVGTTASSVFNLARHLVEACRIQLLAESGGRELLEISSAVCEITARHLNAHNAGRGSADWPAYLRELDAVEPGFRL